MAVNEEVLENLKVIKRNGKKVDFNGAKIALAIKKGFDNLDKSEYAELSEGKEYTEKDMQKVYQSVIKRIEKEYKDEEKIKIFCVGRTGSKHNKKQTGAKERKLDNSP